MDLHALIQELIDIRMEVEHELQIAESASARAILVSLEESASKIGRAWSQSWIGDQAYLYYRDFETPPPDKEFDQLSGKLLRDQTSWVQYSDEEVLSRIYEGLDVSDIECATKIANKCAATFEEKKDDVISILELADHQEHSYINGIRVAIKNFKIPSANQIIKNLAPNSVMTRDIIALSKGSRTPPHISLFARVASIRQGIDTLSILEENVDKAVKHLRRAINGGTSILRNGKSIFIGHGRSNVWLQLEKFLKERLKQTVDEFNRVPTGGISNTERISEMLDNAVFAFLVLTAEDEQVDGKMQARMNVIHETGLFQGRLGFKKAIILLENGCDEFSNIEGLGQIRFPKDDLTAKSEEIRRVLEDRDIIPG